MTSTAGRNKLNQEGLDPVVEGDAVRVTDELLLRRAADLYEATYDPDWHYDVRDGMIVGLRDNIALVFVVAPTTPWSGAVPPNHNARACRRALDAHLPAVAHYNRVDDRQT